MIFLVLPTLPPQIAACEDEAHAASYRLRGFAQVNAAQFSAAWSERDTATRLISEIMPPNWAGMQDEPAPDTRHKIIGATPGVVYPKTETGL